MAATVLKERLDGANFAEAGDHQYERWTWATVASPTVITREDECHHLGVLAV